MNFEAEYFNKYAGSGYKLTKEREGMFKMLYKLVRRHQPRVSRILDIGCAFGYFLKICEEEGIETYGVDVSEYAIRQAKNFTRGAKLYVLNVSKDKLPFRDNFFDVVTMFDVLEHLSDDTHALTEVFRVLGEEGLLFATTPNASARIWRPTLSDRTHINVHDRKYWATKLRKLGFSRIEIKVCIAYGVPPHPKVREITGWFIMKPLFLPLEFFGSELFIYAIK